MQTEPIAKPTYKGLAGVAEHHPVRLIVALAFAATLIIETASRHSLAKGIEFLFAHPLHFAINLLIVLTTLAIGLFFRRRVFVVTFFTLFWLALGLINAIVLSFRVTPFSLVDITLLPSVSAIISVYIEKKHVLLIIGLIVAVLVIFVFTLIKGPKYAPSYKKAVLAFALSAALTLVSYSLTVVGHEDARNKLFANISDAYDHYGFVYCFCTEAVDQGISRPDTYSQRAVNRIVRSLSDREPAAPEQMPNIIMVQLESFFDVSYLKGLHYAEDPIPTFTALKENYSSGFLTVPSIGAGTANTEFEVLSGMSMDFFGMGEYPYKTILREEACESIAADLKAYGYTAHAVHNHKGTFYGRNEVFAQLGFDTFTSIEFMGNVDYNPINWARDEVLTEEILKALDASQEQSFIFTITVQTHGKYQKGANRTEGPLPAVQWESHEEDRQAFAYYLSQLRETDAFIADLIAALEARGEPTVLVLYGDHLPSFDISADQLENGDIFQTEYVIWDNIGLSAEHKDLSAYQLSAEVLKRIGLSGGVLSKYHQQMAERKSYIDGLGLLEYDMLYGSEFYCYGGANPYTASELKMGVVPITISAVSWENGILTVSGENFTKWSQITVNGEPLDTTIADGETLTAERSEPPADGDTLTVRQVAATSAVLYESEAFRVRTA